MKTINLYKISLLLAFLITTVSYPQLFEELINPVNLVSGEPDSIMVSDLFFSRGYDLEFEKNDNIEINFLRDNRILVLTPIDGFEGFTVVTFKDRITPALIDNAGSTQSIPVQVNSRQLQSFSYTPKGKPSKVNLFGNFNSWNREEFPMQDTKGNGTYELSIPLEPGRYEYKFFVDGKEYYDLLNPDKISNGMGDYNSLITVPQKYFGDFSVHIISHEDLEDTLLISFFLDNDEREIAFTKQNIFCFIDNTLIDEGNIFIEGNKYSVKLSGKSLKGNKTFRTVVTQGGRISNMQTIKLFDGKPAGNNTNSWEDAIIYSLMIDRFNDGDKTNSIPIKHPELHSKANYNGGDFQGILAKLEEGYFDSLGINTIWLSPVIENTNKAYKEYPPPHRWYTGYHGYWPVDPVGVEEKFGNLNLLKNLIRTAQKKNIKVLLDYVAHHVHIEHPLWKNNPGWFGTLDLPDGRKNLRLWDEHRLTTWFEPYLPSFDFIKSDEALTYMTENAVWWLKETGADGFRHDAVKHVPNSFWRRLTEKIRNEIEIPESKMVYQIGETFGSYELVSSYVNNGQLDAQFNFILYDTAVPVFSDSTVPFRYLDEQLKKTFSIYGHNHLMGNVMDSHDKVRFMAFADGDVTSETNQIEIGWTNPPKVDNPDSYKKLQLYMAYMLSVPGIPIIYYGDEIGMSGAADPDNRRMMRFDNAISLAERENLEIVSSIIKIRRGHPALRYGDFHTLLLEKDVYAYMRTDLNERIIVILNKGITSAEMNIELPKFLNIKKISSLSGNEEINYAENKLRLKIEPQSYRFFKAE